MLIFWRDLNRTFSRQISCHLISLEYENYKQTLSLGGGFKHFSFSPRKNWGNDPQLVQLNHQLDSLDPYKTMVFFGRIKTPQIFFPLCQDYVWHGAFVTNECHLGTSWSWVMEVSEAGFVSNFDPAKKSFWCIKKTTVASETMDIYI